jgi:Legionella pneumophila major outer membrane protein precursor
LIALQPSRSPRGWLGGLENPGIRSREAGRSAEGREDGNLNGNSRYQVILDFAGVVQWQNGSFPSCIRGFDSLRPLQSSNPEKWKALRPAGVTLIGTEESRINFSSTSPALAGNNQSLTSPNATRVLPSIDARLATAYTFAPSAYGLFKVEVGYRAAVYFGAVNQYSLTQVPTSLMLPPVGVFLATAQHLQSNFTDQGPYVTASWSFW